MQVAAWWRELKGGVEAIVGERRGRRECESETGWKGLWAVWGEGGLE